MQLDAFTRFNLLDYVAHIRTKIKQWVGIPVLISVTPTKTLAKIANKIAKSCTTSGVFSLLDKSVQEEVLSNFAISDIWVIGHQLTKKLQQLSIYTAKQLRDANPKMIRKYFGVVVERIVLELQGVSCLELEEIQPPKKKISCPLAHLGKWLPLLKS